MRSLIVCSPPPSLISLFDRCCSSVCCAACCLVQSAARLPLAPCTRNPCVVFPILAHCAFSFFSSLHAVFPLYYFCLHLAVLCVFFGPLSTEQPPAPATSPTFFPSVCLRRTHARSGTRMSCALPLPSSHLPDLPSGASLKLGPARSGSLHPINEAPIPQVPVSPRVSLSPKLSSARALAGPSVI